MSMTDSIYDVELYTNSFLFTPEEYSSTKSKDKLPIKCSHCGKTFYRRKDEIQKSIKKGQTSFYCSNRCVGDAKFINKKEPPYTCKFCGKIFTELPSKYASGEFCSLSCTKKYANTFANSDEIRKKKSNDMCDKLGIPHKTSLQEKPSEIKIRVAKQKEEKLKNYKKKIKQSKCKDNSLKYKELYDRIMNLYETHNLYEIRKCLSLSYDKYKTILKYFPIQNNQSFVDYTKYALIDFCKRVLNKSHGITHSDVEEVRHIIEHHMYNELLSPHDISTMYNLEKYKNGDFINFLKKCLKVNTKSLKEANNDFHKKKGTYNKLSEKELYYNKCKFRFGFSIPQIQGFELIKKYGIFSNENINGVARDHIVSISYGWENNIPPEMISHPANCQIVLQSDNARKSSGCSITVEELKERIKLWEEGLPLPEVEIIGSGNRTKTHREALANSLKEHYKN